MNRAGTVSDKHGEVHKLALLSQHQPNRPLADFRRKQTVRLVLVNQSNKGKVDWLIPISTKAASSSGVLLYGRRSRSRRSSRQVGWTDWRCHLPNTQWFPRQ